MRQEPFFIDGATLSKAALRQAISLANLKGSGGSGRHRDDEDIE
jgi:hypothetical protein